MISCLYLQYLAKNNIPISPTLLFKKGKYIAIIKRNKAKKMEKNL